MAFEKGNKVGAGRPKGAENKETKKIREWIGLFLEKNLSKLEADIDSLEPKDRVKAISDLMEYAVPKLARVENVGDEGGAINIRIIRDGDTNQTEQTPQSPEPNNSGTEAV